jgi:hypothetical protein
MEFHETYLIFMEIQQESSSHNNIYVITMIISYFDQDKNVESTNDKELSDENSPILKNYNLVA